MGLAPRRAGSRRNAALGAALRNQVPLGLLDVGQMMIFADLQFAVGLPTS